MCWALLRARSTIEDISDRLEYLVHPSKMKRMAMRRCLGDVVMPIITGSPPSFSLADKVVEVYEQGRSQSCTACAICSAYCIMNNKDPSSFRPSRYYIYARERQMEMEFKINGGSLVDTGAYESDGLHWAESHGLCPESKWPSTGDINKIPPLSCDKEACSHRIKGIVRVPKSIDFMKALISKGHPILTALELFSSIITPTVASTGILPLPSPLEPALGGHEVLAVGYDDNIRMVLMLNSWGTKWGMQPIGASSKGYFWVPYDYIMKYAISMYTFESVVVV